MIFVLAPIAVFISYKFIKKFKRNKYREYIKTLPNAYDIEVRRSKNQWRGGF